MLKKPFLILACIVLGFIGTSHGFSLVDFLNNLFSSSDPTPDSSSNPVPPLNLCPETQCNPESGGVFEKVPEVNKFIKTFLEAVYKSDTLRNAFDLSDITPKKNAELVKQYTDHVLCEIGVDTVSAAAIGKFAAAAIPQIDSLTMPIVSRAYANMAANFLFAERKLNQDNAEKLAMSLENWMEDRAKTIMNAEKNSKFFALADGFVGFFLSKGVFTPTKAPILGYYVGNQWLLVANDPCLNKKHI